MKGETLLLYPEVNDELLTIYDECNHVWIDDSKGTQMSTTTEVLELKGIELRSSLNYSYKGADHKANHREEGGGHLQDILGDSRQGKELPAHILRLDSAFYNGHTEASPEPVTLLNQAVCSEDPCIHTPFASHRRWLHCRNTPHNLREGPTPDTPYTVDRWRRPGKAGAVEVPSPATLETGWKSPGSGWKSISVKSTSSLRDTQLYQKALSIKSAIPHPRIMGIIHECGGKMHMAEGQWTETATDFFEAFKNYDEAGNQRRIQCLKYLVLANMLLESEVNPFDGQEAKPYKNDPEILAMTNLIAAYQRNDILEFEKILKVAVSSNRRTIMDDPFIRNYIEDLLKNIRTQVLLKLIKPYTRIRIPFISKVSRCLFSDVDYLAVHTELNVPEKDVEQLLVSLILDNRINGHIDQVNRLLEHSDRSKGTRKYGAIDKWNTQLRSLYQTITNR
ncbi:hypothetical protein Taro_022791, partial [Colocasia esculenta]|nr:hypothetical protein [Colocasia esculenta]